jgi:hypothetical protein
MHCSWFCGGKGIFVTSCQLLFSSRAALILTHVSNYLNLKPNLPVILKRHIIGINLDNSCTIVGGNFSFVCVCLCRWILVSLRKIHTNTRARGFFSSYKRDETREWTSFSYLFSFHLLPRLVLEVLLKTTCTHVYMHKRGKFYFLIRGALERES